jgi:beta-1,2-mannobiose phosphorylase / 1,2-beta-oligomannan phosphorylase
VGAYATGALLLDPNDPARILRRTPASIFEPSADFERRGFVPDVVFPTGITETGSSFLVYYGAADCCTAVVEFNRDELLAGLRA